MAEVTPLTNFVSGAAAGAAQIVVGYPFDTIKVKMQVGTSVAGSAGRVPATPMDCFRTTVSQEGVRGLFRGMSSPLVGSLVFNSLLFGCFEEFKKLLSPEGQPATPLVFATSAALTGVVESSVYCPTELIKTRMQTAHAESNVGVTRVVGDIVRTRGIGGLFTGLAPTILREAPGNVVYFTSYEIVRGWCPPTWGDARSILAGGMAGIAYWFTQFPMDVIKTRIQADSIENPRYRNVVHCARLIVREEGVKSLFRGLSPCLVRAFPANAVAFYVFELSRTTLTGMTQRIQWGRATSTAPLVAEDPARL